jgi:outer membrane protein assembly factor BamB
MRPMNRRLLRRGLAASTVVLVALGGAAAFVLLHAPGNVSHPDVQFTGPTTTAARPPRRVRALVDNFQWPWYGYDAGRTRFFAATNHLRPPLHTGWRFNDGALLEFPPVIYHEALYLLGDGGVAKALSAVTGHELWQRKLGTLAAASPAVAGGDGLVLMPVLSTHGRSPGNGRFVALSMRTGRIVWSRPIPAGSESSAIVDGRNVYFGDEGGTLWALRLADGRVAWKYHASGAIKGGPALVHGVLYFGDYAGRVYAVGALSGRQVWAVGTDGAHFGFGSGQFYSSPAVAFGRVYLGNTDGRVYSFGARTGALAWATGTGAYVYASPSVADPPGLGPTVYVGSYDANMYAFNAQSGAIRWRHPAGGKISGSSTVIGGVLYYSDLGTKTTAGLDAATGHQVFAYPHGAFTPVIADFHAIYLDGYSVVYQLLPGRRAASSARRPKRRTTGPGHRHGAASGRTRHRASRTGSRAGKGVRHNSSSRGRGHR